MRRVAEFVRLSGRDRGLLLRAGVLVLLVRIALWTRPFHRVRSRLDAWGHARSLASSAPDGPWTAPVERIAWAVRSASRLVPDATCLTQALVGHAWLARTGRTSELRIGVARGDAGGLEAHAWLEVDGDVVLGRLHDLDRYTPLDARRRPSP